MIRDKVHHLRLSALPGRSAQARLRGERRLADLDATRLGFGQSAIVCIRHLRLRGSWPDLRSLASRPALDDSGADLSEVVWFQDGAELLACLARDAGGARLSRWWWPLLLEGAPTAVRVARAFADDVSSSRAALERIRSSAHLEAFRTFLGGALVRDLERAGAGPRDRHPSTDPVAPSTGSAEVLSGGPDRIPRAGSGIQPGGRPADFARSGPRDHAADRLGPVLPPAPDRPMAGREDGSSPPGRDDALPTDFVSLGPGAGAPPAAAPLPPREPGAASSTPRASPLGTDPAMEDGDSPVVASRVSRSAPAIHAPSPATDEVLASEPLRDPFADRSREASRRVREADETPLPGSVLASPEPLLLSSEFGGLLFVLDALLALEWIPDFTRPLDPGDVAPLDYLLRLGHHRFGRRFAADPLRRWLADQLDPLPPSRPPERLDELEGRIALALGRSPRRAIHFLCRRRALLRISSGRIEAEFRLEEHPLEIRLAGLDRDPGWIPSTGWDFRFHFAVGGA